MREMSHPTSAQVHRTLTGLRQGNRTAADELFSLLYSELKVLAGRQLRNERKGHTLQPTGLVHEAYLRLMRAEEVDREDRARFFAIAAQAIRRVLIDHARRRRSAKRGGDWQRITLAAGEEFSERDGVDLLALEEALKKLAALDPRQARIVELRFFGGLGMAEIALALDVSKRTVQGDWAMAKGWLHGELRAEDSKSWE
jgi:RNA polymerase sigma factor (TIGR02999 family)